MKNGRRLHSMPFQNCNLAWGSSSSAWQEVTEVRRDTYMTSALGGGGGPPKAEVVRKLSRGGCVNLRTRGEGVQKSQNFVDVI